MNRPSFSLIIIAHNNESSIEYVINDTYKNLKDMFRSFEIIVIDNKSSDKTRKLLSKLQKKSRRIRVYRQNKYNFAKALTKGISLSSKKYIGYMKADGQDLIRDIINCINAMQKYDLVLGTRGKRIDYDFLRLILSYGCMLFYRVLFAIKSEDVHWVYIWKAKEIKKLKLGEEGDVFVLVESLIKFREKNLNIGERSAPYRPRFAGGNSEASLYTIISMVKSMLQTKRNLILGDNI